MMDFVLRHWDLFALLAVILGLLALTGFADRLSGVKSLSPTQAVQLMNRSRVLILDLRPEPDFAASHLAQARHLPPDDIPQAVQGLANGKQEAVLLIGPMGGNVSKAAKAAREAGIEQVYLLRGGMAGWQEANLPVTRG